MAAMMPAPEATTLDDESQADYHDAGSHGYDA
jgi:hypothetical protein